jgi:hypothetical protein
VRWRSSHASMRAATASSSRSANGRCIIGGR